MVGPFGVVESHVRDTGAGLAHAYQLASDAIARLPESRQKAIALELLDSSLRWAGQAVAK